MRRLLLVTASVLLPVLSCGRSDAAIPSGHGFGSVAGIAKADIGEGAASLAGSGIVLAADSTSYNPAGQDLGAGTSLTAGSTTARTLAARGADVFNPRDFGATGNGSSLTIGSKFGSTVSASLAAFAVQSIGGTTPFSWMMQPQFGLQFSMATSTDQGGAGTVLTFLENLTGINNWSASVALWQDPAHGNYLVLPGMLVTDRAGAIASGTTVSSVNRTPGLGYGTITLSRASNRDVPPGDAITFTIAPAQLQALTLDWLGIQSAMAGAWNAGAGGTVYIPSGNYLLNHSLVNAGGITDTSQQVSNLDLHGDGMAETRLIFSVDLGQDMCAILSGGRGTAMTSLSSYHDFRIIGPLYTRMLGAKPNGMDGVCVGEGDKVVDVNVANMRAGINGVKDHWFLREDVLSNNGYGVYFAPYSSTMGNQLISDTGMGGNTIASIAVATTNQIDAATIRNSGTGFSPYGFYAESNTANVASQLGGVLTNSVLENVAVEAVGNSWIYGAGQTGIVQADTFIGGGFLDVGMQTSYAVPGGSPGGIFVKEFSYNTMIGTFWSPYSSVRDAIVNVSDNCSYNTWQNDYNFVFGATASVAPLKCGDNKSKNEFVTGSGDGIFRQVGIALPAGMAVSDNGYVLDVAFTDGRNFAGITATAAAAGEIVGILTHADFLPGVLKADPGQSVTPGQPVFATTGGVAAGMDQDGAIGVAVAPSGPGTTTLYLDLDAGVKGGALGITTNATAAGTTQATAYVVTMPTVQFTRVASGAGAILGVIPTGKSIFIANDGANTLLVYPQAGGQIGSASANAGVPVAPGSSATFRRLSTTLWHQ